MYLWTDANSSGPLNVTFQPSSLPPEGSDIAWVDVLGSPEYLLTLTLQNMSLAALALLALKEASTSNSKRLLFPLTRLLGCKGLCHVILVNVLKTVLGLVLMLASLPVMLPFMVFFWLTSFLARLIYALRWGSCVKKVQGLDCVWGVEEEENKPFITACLRVCGAPDLHSVQQAILTKVVEVRDKTGGYKYHKFRQLFSQRCGYYCWRDDPCFDINNHVREVELNNLFTETISGDATDLDEAAADKDKKQTRSETADELLQQFVSEELTTAMPEDIPQWEVLLVARDDGR